MSIIQLILIYLFLSKHIIAVVTAGGVKCKLKISAHQSLSFRYEYPILFITLT